MVATTAPGLLMLGAVGLLGMLLDWPLTRLQSAGLGAAVATGPVLIGILFLTPWKARPAGDFPIAWMGATLVRFLLTPTLLFLIYSSTPSAEAFLLSAGATYLACLAAEAVVIVRAMRRTTPPPT